MVQAVAQGPQTDDPRRQLTVLADEAGADGRPTRDDDRAFRAAAECAQGVEDDRDIDGLLEQRADHHGQVAEGREDHRHDRETHPGHDALDRDPCEWRAIRRPRPAGPGDRPG